MSSTLADAQEAPRLVVACLACTDPRPRVDQLTGQVERDPAAATLSPCDEAALEHAVHLAEAGSLGLLVVAAGTASVEPVLREALSLGGAVLRVEWPPGGGGQGYVDGLVEDEWALARAVAGAIRDTGRASVVLCGDRSSDRGTGAFPSFLAHELGAAQALGLVGIEVADGGLVVERRLDGGRRELLRVGFPAVCSVEAAGTRLRRGSLSRSITAASSQIPVRAATVEVADTGRVRVVRTRAYVPRPRVIPAPIGGPRERLVTLTGALSDRQAAAVVGPVGAPEAADVLLGYLARNGFLAETSPSKHPGDGAGDGGPGRPGRGVEQGPS